MHAEYEITPQMAPQILYCIHTCRTICTYLPTSLLPTYLLVRKEVHVYYVDTIHNNYYLSVDLGGRSSA